MIRQSASARLKKLEDLIYAMGNSGANPLVTSPWIPLAGGAHVIAAGPQKILSDSTAAPVALSFAANAIPADQSIILIKDYTGKAGVNPITLDPPTGWTIELPGNPGNFGAQASMTTQGGAWAFQVYTKDSKLVLVWTA